MAKKSAKSNLVPKQVVDKNGKLTTVYVNPNDLDGADIKASKQLDKTLRKSSKDRKAFDSDEFMKTTRSDVEKVDENLDESYFFDPQKRGDLIRTYKFAKMQAKAYDEIRKDFKMEILQSVTDKDISEGNVLVNDDETMCVEVALEKDKFYPERSGLNMVECAECFTTEIDTNRARQYFPDVCEETMTTTGDVELETNLNEDRRLALNQTRSLRRKYEEDERDVVSLYIETEDEQFFYEDFCEKVDNEVRNVSLTPKEEKKLKSGVNLSEGDSLISQNVDTSFYDEKTGSTGRIVPSSSCDRHDFVQKVRDRALKSYEQTEQWSTFTDGKKERILSSYVYQNTKDFMVYKVDTDKVKELYPDKYEKGRPRTKVMYVSEF